MAENDIYGSKEIYEREKNKLSSYLEVPTGNRKYQIKNKDNLKHFESLFKKLEARDLSYKRRLALFRCLLRVTNYITKDLAKAEREDMDKVMIGASKELSPRTRKDMVDDLRFVWRLILPDKDEKGRIDDDMIPYAVRHLNGKIDKSKQKRKEDKLTLEEIEKLIGAFGDDIRIQALIALALESLARPQELLYLKIKDVELHDNYAKIYVSEHGKEGTKFLSCIDSFRYLTEWLNKHPLKSNPNAYLFITLGRRGKYGQLKPDTITKHIRNKCELLGIKKPITFYSIKRNGVTIRRLRGDSDLDIQHTAGWTSTKQLKTYDLSTHDDSFKIELVKRGLIKPEGKFKDYVVEKKCLFCATINGIADTICKNCKRPLDREVIEKEEKDIKDRLDKTEIMLLKVLAKLEDREALNYFTPELKKKYVGMKK